MQGIKLVMYLQQYEQLFVLVQYHINTVTTASDKICLMVIGQIYWLSMKWLTRYSTKKQNNSYLIFNPMKLVQEKM